MKAKKSLLIIAAVVVIAAIAIGGTLAYLTASSNEVTNTFTVGEIDMTLFETGEKDTGGEKTSISNEYKIIPGATVAKDPTVYITAGSEECYVYVLIENSLVIEEVAGETTIYATVATTDIDTTDWEVVIVDGTKTLYRYKATINALDATDDIALDVFTKLTFDGDKINETNIAEVATGEVVLNGYAYQAEGVTQAVADAAAIAYFFPPVVVEP